MENSCGEYNTMPTSELFTTDIAFSPCTRRIASARQQRYVIAVVIVEMLHRAGRDRERFAEMRCARCEVCR